MNNLTQEDLRLLLNQAGQWCVSLYLPTHRGGAEVRQDPVRFKNSLRAAEHQLLSLGVEEEAARRSLRPMQELLTNEPFWQQQSDGLAVFLHQDFFRCYRLPMDVPELTIVTERFHLKPLLRVLSGSGNYHLLTLSQNHVAFFEGTRYRLRELEMPGMPLNLVDALGKEEAQQQLQFQGPARGKRGGIIHGHSDPNTETKDRMLRFFHQLNAHLRDHLTESHTPLVLAGVEYLLPIYREANTYPHLLAEGIHGNPEHMPASELLARAWAIVEPQHQQSSDQARALYLQMQGTGRTINRVDEAVTAAMQGRVGTLFVPVGVHRWGHYDAAEQAIEMHREAEPGDEDLLDRAALQTLAHGGTVFVVKPEQMPDSMQIAAILRY